MRERPILFSGAMVRAILEGRKTQTRRIVKPQPEDIIAGEPCFLKSLPNNAKATRAIPCPYGQPGDRLWVRETWGLVRPGDPTHWYDDRLALWPLHLIRASWDVARRADWGPHQEACFWRPSIFMPRWASRITLEVTGVRVERLHDITDEDATAEGVREHIYAANEDHPALVGYVTDADGEFGAAHVRPTEAFAHLWRSINGAESWDANPWVWVVEFKRVAP